MSQKLVRTIEYDHGDLEDLTAYRESVRQVAGLMVELMGENRVALLSPVIRELAAKEAKKLQDLHTQLAVKLCVDNP